MTFGHDAILVEQVDQHSARGYHALLAHAKHCKLVGTTSGGCSCGLFRCMFVRLGELLQRESAACCAL